MMPFVLFEKTNGTKEQRWRYKANMLITNPCKGGGGAVNFFLIILIRLLFLI